MADITLENLDEHLSHDFEFEHIVDSGCGHRASSIPTIDMRIIHNRLFETLNLERQVSVADIELLLLLQFLF